jgi:raffinose/stachyose/melibiose transport system substrate-binding protein
MWRKVVVAVVFLACSGLVAFAAGGAEGSAASKPANITFFSSLADRTSGLGLLEETMMSGYTKENPSVKFTVEALNDEAYKQKFQAYVASNSLPDCIGAYLAYIYAPAMKSGQLAELNPKDYTNYDFFPGSLDNFTANGKLYGLPYEVTTIYFYYNQAVFAQNGVKVPASYQELLDAVKAFKSKGVTPIAMNGKDMWSLGIFIQDIILKTTGARTAVYDALDRKISYAADPNIKKGTDYAKQLFDLQPFQESFTAADYGASKNLFTQGQAAMWYMGAWEMGMAGDTNIPEDIRNNLRAIQIPAANAGKATDIVSWGGGRCIASKSKVKTEAIKFLNWMFKQENWAKKGMEMGLVIPCQKFDSFLTGKEGVLQKQIINMLIGASSLSAPAFIDASTPEWKVDTMTLSQSFAAGLSTPEQFLQGLDKAANKAKAASN